MVDTPETSIIPRTYDQLTVPAESDRVRQLRAAVRAPNTRRAYASNWGSFEEWCLGKQLEALLVGEDVVAEYLAYLAAEGCAPSSVSRAYSALLATLRESAPETWPPGLRPHKIAEVL